MTVRRPMGGGRLTETVTPRRVAAPVCASLRELLCVLDGESVERGTAAEAVVAQ
jgi:hypothetical protein